MGRSGRGFGNNRGSRVPVRNSDLVDFSSEGAPDTHAVFAPLHFEFGDSGFLGQLDELTNLVECHNRIA
jgi:hypothetical protein